MRTPILEQIGRDSAGNEFIVTVEKTTTYMAARQLLRDTMKENGLMAIGRVYSRRADVAMEFLESMELV